MFEIEFKENESSAVPVLYARLEGECIYLFRQTVKQEKNSLGKNMKA